MYSSRSSRSGTPTKGYRTPLTPGSPSKYTSFHQPRRRTHIVRILSISLAIVLCYILVTHNPKSSTWTHSSVQDKINFGDHATKPVAEYEPPRGYGDTESGRWTETTHEQEDIKTDNGKEMEHTVNRVKGDDEAEYEKLKDSQADTKEPDMKAGSDYVSETGSDRASVVDLSDDTESVPTAHKIGNGDKESLREALKDILDNMPDETHAGKLLQPLEGGGQERLKELGTKIRAFHKYFATWETLHVVNNSKLAYVRDDVIQYLENAPEKELSEVSQLERGDIVRAYERYRAFLGRLSHMLFPYTSPYFGDHMALHSHFRNGGRGIVLSGNDKQAPYILTSLKVIRKLGSSLPVEIMYLENELNEDWRTKLEAVPGVIARNLSQMVSDEGWELKGSASKPFALLMSSFREVIYLDADALFFVNPEVLFEDPGYVETGTLFFRDRITSPSSRKQWLKDMLPKPISRKAQTSRYWTGKSREQQDSGVLVVDKWRHFVAMLTVARMNGPDRDDNPKTGSKGVFSLFYGDKETFWLGWELAGDTDYWFNEGATGNMGIVSEQIHYKLVDGKAEVLKDYQPPTSQSTLEKETAEDTGKANDLSDEPDLGVTTSHEKRDLPIHPLYTISSPQLLHLSTSNRPLWFSGWILDDNFEDPKDTAISIWENYLSETKETNEPAEWRIAGHGMATLKSNKLFKFTAKENDALSMIVETAREVGAVRMRR
ncbi:hypothetical protein E4T38_04337 [Aureobasidium subglaciale]|nr:hypothetical protein E4T38_04337 [Aureobasidium subglaciale]KAI5224163.1 hypothetical protein E4T40_04113 [Aureobasidium subglaciale]KAI5228316.1 hypothetical protein E4T41_03874 [Aureobasidium subglaciale]KAI5262885.1 hypothetical protein E4T46_04081 [Aureobasidium subglaciale]